MEKLPGILTVKGASISRLFDRIKARTIESDEPIMFELKIGGIIETALGNVINKRSFLIDKASLGDNVEVVFQIMDKTERTKIPQRIDISYRVLPFDDVSDLLECDSDTTMPTGK